MITRDLTITVNNNTSSLSEPVTIYRGDRGIRLNCKIVQYKFQFRRTSEENIITETNIINARVLVHKPNGDGCFEVPLAKVKDDIVVVPISADWLDEISEIGTYRLQIQLYGEDPAQQRVTIPPIEFTVRDTLCDINENFSDIAGYALTDTSAIKLKGDSYNADLNNGYTPTIWVTGDIITSTSLNKMEEAIEYSVDKVNAINGVEDNDKVDYMGNHHTSLKNKADADVEYILGEVNTVHYEGQHITATDTIERQVKSAVFKGQTLVNLAPKFNDNRWIKNGSGIPSVIKTDDYVEINVTSAGSAVVEFKDMTLFKLNTDYTFIINILENTFSSVALTDFSPVNKSLATGCNKFKLTSNGSTDLLIRIGYTGHLGANSKLRISNIVVLEGDYTNVDIPYFEGMASVNAPTVKTVGKNLFEINVIPTTVNAYKRTPVITPTQREEISINPILKLTPNTTYTFSINSNGYNIPRHVIFGFSSKSDILFTINWASNAIDSTFEFTTDKTGEVYLHGYQTLLVDSNLPNLINTLKQCKIQLELGETKTAYEPYSSSSLTLPEEVILRSLPNGVCDTFNTRTGDYVQRIGEKTLEELSRIVSFSSIEWSNLSSHGAYQLVNIVNHINVNCNAHGQNMWSDNYAWAASYHGGSYDNPNDNLPNVFLAFSNDGHLRLMVRKTLIKPDSPQEVTSNDIMNWGRQSAILSTRIQYQLKTPIITTIDLKNQKIYSYDGTTYYTTASAQGHPAPILSIDVPTNLPALVSRQRATIQALTVENQEIKAVNEAQDTDIALNQEAINFMLFQSTSMMLSEQTKGINPMSTYLANQIIKGKLSYDLVVEKYEDFKEDIDIILMDKRGEELDKLNK